MLDGIIIKKENKDSEEKVKLDNLVEFVKNIK